MNEDLSENHHFQAWSAIYDLLTRLEPGWCSKIGKTPLENAVATIEKLQRDSEFYKRLLVQACLSNDGKIDIDPSKAPEAMASERTLEFGNGKITFLGSEHSLFPEHLDTSAVHVREWK